jgi:UDP-GlcNAc:undecaprenyl-phosphate GlcNAc-1-phosphate transferase
MNTILIIYFLFSFLLFFIVTRISYKLNLVDVPNIRKKHAKPTAFTGGLVISTAILLMCLSLNSLDSYLKLILFFTFAVSLVGICDDIFNLNTFIKLFLQIIIISYLLTFEKLNLLHLGDYNYFLLELSFFSIPVTLISILILTNSFNYFDGADGTLSFMSISVLGILYFLIPDEIFRLFLIIIFIPIFIFIFFNFSFLKLPKNFLGNCGSFSLGFLISCLLIYLANKNTVHPILLAWSIVIFIYEFLAINYNRVIKKKNIFNAGNDHLHNILFNITKSLFLTNFFITSANLVLFLIGYLSYFFISSFISLILFILLYFIFLFFRNKLEFFCKESN